uniref:Uncharacterized protein n=1 Tax=Moumouvirus sp. 'Monve' TaxID=1128131 RepID=H2ECW9_9VIRU|nr:hypothetical protein mv_L37 [Moumouvirus Monve]
MSFEKLYVVSLVYKYGDAKNSIEGIFSKETKARSHMKKIAKQFLEKLNKYQKIYKMTDLKNNIILQPIEDNGEEEDVYYF